MQDFYHQPYKKVFLYSKAESSLRGSGGPRQVFQERL